MFPVRNVHISAINRTWQQIKSFLIRSLPSLHDLFSLSLCHFLLQIWSLRDGDETWQNHTRLPKNSLELSPPPLPLPLFHRMCTCFSKSLAKGRQWGASAMFRPDIWPHPATFPSSTKCPNQGWSYVWLFRIRVLPSFPNFVTVDEELRNSDRWMELPI